jgi:hypothetical protein
VLGTGQIEVFAQDLEERLMHGDEELVLFAVDVEDERQPLRQVYCLYNSVL